ncbi:MAG TPA: TetR/AcrR family transcriptional regulator [Bacteroidales bacterium]|nr:TetR/AcrR family transcriptional regulator [Bacteroidales bacterium]HPF03410.1 TetR/AcrR family transcriptional regulator [Bacteroidales bacterium]HPR12931.1 TetR/AcrR family transcriptional regulator [Bacteroidales bacterium]HRW86352.1 TetR/AcrR family transcriptional regulator [Bacteroidales bacterium]
MINKEEFRQKVIATAGCIFSRYGFRKTTMEEIARELKMGKSSIYYYFASKEDIFEAVVLHEANVLRNELTTAIKLVESPVGKMKNYVFVRMKAFEKLSNYYNAIFDKNLDHFDFIERIRSRYDREELAILRLILWDGARKKVFNVANSEYTALAVQTTLKGLEVPLFWQKKEVDIEKRLTAILEVLFNGILRKQTPFLSEPSS